MPDKIGIIGNGFVGDAVHYGFSASIDNIKVYDKDHNKSLNTIEEVLDCEFVFVCLPTPMRKAEGGDADLSILINFFSYVAEVEATEAIYILKSTVPVGTTEMLSSLHEDLKIVHNPEFLTANNARQDFANAERTVIGGHPDITRKVSELYTDFMLEALHEEPILVHSRESELIKYSANCFLALKVSYFNTIFQLCQGLGIDFENVIAGTCSDSRIGYSHSSVPGPDGDFGYGGTCFPKDVNAMIKMLNRHDVNADMLKASWLQNLSVRKFWDWSNSPSAVTCNNGDQE